MKPLTKILIAAPILLALFGRYILKTNTALGFYCILFSNIFLVLLLAHLMKESKKSSVMYTIILVLGMVQLIGSVFKILHLPLADVLLWAGFAGTIIAGLTLISTSLKNTTNKILYTQFALGIVVLIQSSLPVLSPQVAFTYGGLLSYPIVALSATILLNGTEQNDGERNVLLLLLIQGLFFIFKHVVEFI